MGAVAEHQKRKVSQGKRLLRVMDRLICGTKISSKVFVVTGNRCGAMRRRADDGADKVGLRGGNLMRQTRGARRKEEKEEDDRCRRGAGWLSQGASRCRRGRREGGADDLRDDRDGEK